MKRLLSGIAGALPVTVEGEDGPLTLTAPPAVSVAFPDGALAAFGTATGTAGAYVFSVPAQTRLGIYTATVTGTYSGSPVTATVRFEIVGRYLYSIPELRAFDAGLDIARYSDSDVKRTRGYVEDEFYNITLRSFTPRGAVETVDVVNSVFYVTNCDAYRVVSLTLNGVAVDVSTVTIDPIGVGYVLGTGTAVVEYEYGLRFIPEDVKRAAMLRGRTVLYDRDSGIPDRATSFNQDGQQFSLATAGRAGYETGIPEVDAILSRYSIKPPGVA